MNQLEEPLVSKQPTPPEHVVNVPTPAEEVGHVTSDTMGVYENVLAPANPTGVPRGWRARVRTQLATWMHDSVMTQLSTLMPERWPDPFFFSDILWPCLGTLVAMAVLSGLDHFVLAEWGHVISVAPMGSLCAVLYMTPSSPGARVYNMFVAQICCGAIGVVIQRTFAGRALWAARPLGVTLCVVFMYVARAIHPPAAGLPLMFIDGGAQLQHLGAWFALYPGVAGCVVLLIIQLLVVMMKDYWQFGRFGTAAIPSDGTLA